MAMQAPPIEVPPQVIEAYAEFGSAIAVDGDFAMIGSPRGGWNGQGTVHVYRFVDTRWVPTQVLEPSSDRSGQAFGKAIALRGTQATIGAPWAFNGRNYGGFAYAFDLIGTRWVETQKIQPQVPHTGAYFGHAVAIEQDGIIRQFLGKFYADRHVKSSWSFDETWLISYPRGLVDED